MSRNTEAYKPTLKLKFTDFWKDFNPVDNLFYGLLSEYYELVESKDPELIIFSCFGSIHKLYSCHKIFYTGENVRPNFTECDFALTFDYDLPISKHFRVPFYRWNGDLEKLCTPYDATAIHKENRKFCCMVVTNANGVVRNEFFNKLTLYKKVDSGGKYLNNIGKNVSNKMDFLRNYKFTMAFENASYPGYTTEKIVQPMLAGSIPIYWGNPEITRDFSDKSFINVHTYKNLEKVVDRIIEIDNDDNLYQSYLSAYKFVDNVFPLELNMRYIGEILHAAVQNMKMLEPVYSCSLKYKLSHSLLNLFRKSKFIRFIRSNK